MEYTSLSASLHIKGRALQRDMVIDAHVHTPTALDVDALSESMRRNHIEKAVILHWPFEKWDSVAAMDLEELMHRTAPHERMRVAASCRITDSQSLKRGVHDITWLLHKKKICGVKFYPGYEHFYPTDARCNELYDVCEHFEVPAIFHTGDTAPHPGTRVKYADPMHLDEVATLRPNMKIVMAHCGNPFFENAKSVVGKHPNVYVDISGLPPYTNVSNWNKREYVNVQQRVLDMMGWCGGPQKFMFGSDYPIYKQDAYINFVVGMKAFNREEMDRLMHRTAAEVFNL